MSFVISNTTNSTWMQQSKPHDLVKLWTSPTQTGCADLRKWINWRDVVLTHMGAKRQITANKSTFVSCSVAAFYDKIYHYNHSRNVPPIPRQSCHCDWRIQRNWQRDCQSVWWILLFIMWVCLWSDRKGRTKFYFCIFFSVENGAKVVFCARGG